MEEGGHSVGLPLQLIPDDGVDEVVVRVIWVVLIHHAVLVKPRLERSPVLGRSKVAEMADARMLFLAGALAGNWPQHLRPLKFRLKLIAALSTSIAFLRLL